MKVTHTNLGEALGALRERAGLSQIELARETNVSQPYISMIESGAAVPSLHTFLTLVDHLGGEVVIATSG